MIEHDARDEGGDPRLARARAYELLAALLLAGLDAPRLALVRALPGLGEALPVIVDLDGLAVEHQALFGHQVFPFGGVFLGAEGLVGEGLAAATVRAAGVALGLELAWDPSPDHLGQGMRLMGRAAVAEQQARVGGDHDGVRTLVGWQRRVLEQALLPWMPPLWVALAGQPASVWTRVVELAVGLLAHHRDELGGLPLTTAPSSDADPDVQAVLDDPSTGLLTVAQVLVTPARSGVYLARRDLERLARSSDLSPGFGSRAGMLERLLRVAAEYRTLPRLLDELHRLLEARDRAYAGLQAEPGLAPHVPAWRQRVAASMRLLVRLRDAAPPASAEG